MKTGRSQVNKIILLFFSFFWCLPSFAIIIEVPANDFSIIIQNTEDITATDITIGSLFAGAFDRENSSGGTAFPNLDPPLVGGLIGKQQISFSGPPGILSGGFYGITFSGFRKHLHLTVNFSYPSGNDPNDPTLPSKILKSPKRVYIQNSSGTFEFSPDLSELSFEPIPTGFDFFANKAVIVRANEPRILSLFLVSFCFLLLATHRK